MATIEVHVVDILQKYMITELHNLNLCCGFPFKFSVTLKLW